MSRLIIGIFLVISLSASLQAQGHTHSLHDGPQQYAAISNSDLSPADTIELGEADSRIEKINRRIRQLKKEKSGGIAKFIIGSLGGTIGGIATVPTTECSGSGLDFQCEQKGSWFLWGTIVTAGSVLTTWGIIDWAQAASTISKLKAKKYSAEVTAHINTSKKGNIYPALTFKISLN